MPQLLVVKTTSLGDVIHALPAVTDILRHEPSAKIDWVVEESFAELPRLHPGVRDVLSVAIRRWREAWLVREHRREIAAFIRRLRRVRYDLILDMQGLVKSAAIARLARGRRVGFDGDSARDPRAAWFYRRRFAVHWGLHAVERNRRLAAAALGYEPPIAVDYGVQAPAGALGYFQEPYAVLLHASSRPDKQWRDDCWEALGRALGEEGIRSLLPGGSERERESARRLALRVPGAVALPAMNLRDIASLLANAELVVGVDTGLTHLACALKTPVIAIYAASDPDLTGVYGGETAVNLGREGAPPSAEEVLATAAALRRGC
jgi:heptosyltransferase I